MSRIRTLVVVLAGGAGGRLELLTHERAKPAVSFAGTHRLIDFPLSNCRNAGLSDVWVAQQFNPISLTDHLANGRPWDLDRTGGGLLILQPRIGHDGRDGFPNGTADALWRNGPMIREFAPDALVVVSADAVYALDYAAVVAEHAASEAAVTMVTTEVEPGDAGRYGVVQLDGERVTEYVYKPDEHRLQRGLRLQPARGARPPRRARGGVGGARGSRHCAAPGPRRGRPRARAPLRRLLA
jgi:glucose-1-phosphate adenylyltransferase